MENKSSCGFHYYHFLSSASDAHAVRTLVASEQLPGEPAPGAAPSGMLPPAAATPGMLPPSAQTAVVPAASGSRPISDGSSPISDGSGPIAASRGHSLQYLVTFVILSCILMQPLEERMRQSFSPAWDLAGSHGDAVLRDGERIEDRLALLAASVGPVRRVLAAIAARMLDKRGYERLGYARLADYARERPGMSARQLQDLALVHRRLAELSLLEVALVENRLPWSKVRLVARVAGPADQAAWIEHAAAVSTRQLEREVRAAGAGSENSGVDEDSEGEACVRLTLRCTPEVERRWESAKEIAEWVAGRRLSGGEALELIVAEVSSEFPLMPEPGDGPQARENRALVPDDDASPEEFVIDDRAPARPLPALLRLLAGLDTADSFELDRRLLQAVRLEQTLEAAMTPMLRCVTSSEYEWKNEYRSLADYARDALGMSESKARALLRLGDAASFVPQLAHAYRTGVLSWVKAQCLVPLFLLDVGGDEDWRPAWVLWARKVTVRRLERDVRGALAMRTRTSTGFTRCLYYPEKVAAPFSPSELAEQQMCAHEGAMEASERIDLQVEPEVACLFAGVHETIRALIQRETRLRPSDSEVFERLLDRAVLAWTTHAPGAPRPDPVIERDAYRCAVPGCSSRRNLHDHHIVFRSAGGSNAEWNRVTLCAFHHQRGVHRGELSVRGRAPDALVFDLGVRPGKPPHTRFASGDVHVASA